MCLLVPPRLLETHAGSAAVPALLVLVVVVVLMTA